jgi:hypothetical protein
VFAQLGNFKVLKLPLSMPSFEVRLHWHERFQQDPANPIEIRGMQSSVEYDPVVLSTPVCTPDPANYFRDDLKRQRSALFANFLGVPIFSLAYAAKQQHDPTSSGCEIKISHSSEFLSQSSSALSSKFLGVPKFILAYAAKQHHNPASPGCEIKISHS